MSMHQPPQRLTRFFERICPLYLQEGILCDLEEQFYDDLESKGFKYARNRYIWNVICFMRPEILLRNSNKLAITKSIMLSNYVKTAGRNMAKRKFFTFINAFGLSIGIAFCLLIYLYIQDEKSFDQFHVHKDRIYRIEEKAYNLWEPDPEKPYKYSAYLQTGLGPTLEEEVPQVKHFARFNNSSAVVANGDKIFRESVTYTDQGFFEMFSFPLIEGNKSTLFKNKSNIVITEEIAKKYFGTTSALDKSLTLNIQGGQEFVVSGIISEPPANSSFSYEILIPQENRSSYERNVDYWRNFNTPTFVELHKNADLSSFEENLDLIVEKYMRENLEESRERYNAPADIDLFTYQYKSLNDIHLDTQIGWQKSSDPQYSYILGGIAILILLIACINYIALALTSSATRRTEVGIRKTVGAHRGQLILQFTFESVVIATVSLLIGIALVALFLPSFNQFTNKELMLTLPLISQIAAIGILLSLAIGFLAGSYPALFLSGFNPTQVLKSGVTSKVKAGFTRPLIVLQFALSASLIISSLIMFQQMQFVTTKDLGFSSDQVIVVPTQLGYNQKSNRLIQQMRNELKAVPEVEHVGGVTNSFNRGWSRNGYNIDGEHKSAFVYGVDPYYLDVLDIKLKEGRNFNPEIPSDSNAVIINQALAEDMGWDNPLEEHLNWKEDSTGLGAKVIGVSENYNFQSLENPVEPMFLSMDRNMMNMLIKIKPGNISATLDEIGKVYNQLVPDRPYEYTFLDEDVARQYSSYERWMSIMGLSTAFAILISCLGLFGLAGINAINKTKEIGIRKVFGARTGNIFVLLNKQFAIIAVIAFAIATPVSWILMKEWLSGFEYSISIDWTIIIFSIALGLIIALITVSYHAVKAALTNPANALKYE